MCNQLLTVIVLVNHISFTGGVFHVSLLALLSSWMVQQNYLRSCCYDDLLKVHWDMLGSFKCNCNCFLVHHVLQEMVSGYLLLTS